MTLFTKPPTLNDTDIIDHDDTITIRTLDDDDPFTYHQLILRKRNKKIIIVVFHKPRLLIYTVLEKVSKIDFQSFSLNKTVIRL